MLTQLMQPSLQLLFTIPVLKGLGFEYSKEAGNVLY